MGNVARLYGWVLLLCLALILVVSGRSQESVSPDSPSAGAGVASGQEIGSASSPPRPTGRSLLDYLMLSGVCGFLIVGCSLIAVAFIVEHALTIRRAVLMPESLVVELDELIRSGKLDAAMQRCREEPCLLSNVVLAGLERYRSSEFGFAEYRAAAEEAGEEQTGRLYRKTEVLNVIGAISPMLGLTGTVLGMIKSFNVIAATGGTARPDQLAGGISEALITTLMGLLVAIPTMVFFSYFRNRIDSLVAEAGKRVEQLLMPLGRRTR
jgi:biopolymer transport protein ExbB